MRTVQALGAHEVLTSIWAELRRHRQPKLHPEHAGSIAKYLVDHPGCTQLDVTVFIAGVHQTSSLAPIPHPAVQQGRGCPAVARRAPGGDGLRRQVSSATGRTARAAGQDGGSRFWARGRLRGRLVLASAPLRLF
jgi:hypothetical protein